MQPALFQRFCKLAYDKAGIALKPGKEALVTARVSKRVRALQLTDAGDYLDYLETEDDGEELQTFLDVISTHFTNFFREPDHFDLLHDDLAAAKSAGQSRFRIWCAGCATGEEPYSVAMALHDLIPNLNAWNILILATDINPWRLEQARRFRQLLAKYNKGKGGGSGALPGAAAQPAGQRAHEGLGLRMDLDHRLGLDVAQAPDVDEAGVEEVPRRRRDHRQRVARGQLGRGDIAPSDTFEPVVGLDMVTAIAAGRDVTCALRMDGSVWCWGSNDHGQLGEGLAPAPRKQGRPAKGLAAARP